jgi:hypothetical protein
MTLFLHHWGSRMFMTAGTKLNASNAFLVSYAPAAAFTIVPSRIHRLRYQIMRVAAASASNNWKDHCCRIQKSVTGPARTAP